MVTPRSVHYSRPSSGTVAGGRLLFGADAQAQGLAAGSLEHAVPLAGAGQGLGRAVGSVAHGVPLAAAAAALAAAVAALSVTASPMAGAATGGALAAGSLNVVSGSAQDITTFTLTSSVGGSNLPFAIGHVFKQGDVPSGTPIGGDSSLQATIKNTWPDGSAKFALIAGRKTLTANVAATVTLRTNGTVTGGSALTTADLKTAMSGQTCSIACGAFGTVSWDAATTDFDSPFVVHASGPEMSSWVYRKPVGSDAHLVGWIEVRLFVGGQVEVLPWIENGYLNVASPTSKSATYTFTLGTQRESLLIDLPSHTRTPLVSSTRLSHWLSTDPSLTCRHNASYMMSTLAVPSYSAVVASGAARVAALPTTYTPLQVGNYDDPMNDTGYQPAIGLLPEWDVLYLTTSGADATVYGGVVRNGYSAGRWNTHFRDETTNRPLRFSQYATLVAHTNNGASTTSSYTPTPTGTAAPNWDIPHHPSVGYMAYLVTGRWYFMEEVLFAATRNFLHQPNAVRQNTLGILRPTTGASTLRGAAWGLRTLTQAVVVCADDDTTIKAEFVASMESNIAFNHTRYVATTNNPYGMVETYGDNSGVSDGVWTTATWQQDFFTAVAGYMHSMSLPVSSTNRTKVSEFFQWKAKSVVGRLSPASDTNGFLYRDATPYTITIALNDNPDWDTGAGPWPSTWRVIYDSTYSPSNPDNLDDPGPFTDGALRGGNFPSAQSYWGNMMPAISYAVDHAVTGAVDAYARLTGASNWASLVANFNVDPVWSVAPRTPTYLSQQAARLAPGQSIKLTHNLTSDMLSLGEGSNFIQWGISMYHDPVHNEIGFIGKRHSTFPYHWIYYDIAANTWSNSRAVWSTAAVSGHGYDHNACDQVNGIVYHRPYGEKTVRVWDGSAWSTLPAWTQNTVIVGGLTHFPGLGLFYNDGFGLIRWDGSAWSTIQSLGGGSYHDFSEYNSTADVLVFGGGNESAYYKCSRGLSVSAITAPPYTIGANPNTQGIIVSDPNSATLIARQGGTATWSKYDINAATWSSLTQSTGDGSSPQTGLPNLAADGGNAPISVSIESLGVIMFVQHTGSGSTPANVWLYRHS